MSARTNSGVVRKDLYSKLLTKSARGVLAALRGSIYGGEYVSLFASYGLAGKLF